MFFAYSLPDLVGFVLLVILAFVAIFFATAGTTAVAVRKSTGLGCIPSAALGLLFANAVFFSNCGEKAPSGPLAELQISSSEPTWTLGSQHYLGATARFQSGEVREYSRRVLGRAVEPPSRFSPEGRPWPPLLVTSRSPPNSKTKQLRWTFR